MSPQAPPEGYLEVGRIGKPHGIKGDLLVSLTSDLVQRRSVGATFVVVTPSGTRELVIATVRPQKDRWVVHFHGVDDRNAAESLVNKSLHAEALDVEGQIWIHELIGSRVEEVDGTDRGTCVSVIDNPAHDILELSTGALVPATFVVSCTEGVTVIDPPEGLFDLVGDDAP